MLEERVYHSSSRGAVGRAHDSYGPGHRYQAACLIEVERSAEAHAADVVPRIEDEPPRLRGTELFRNHLPTTKMSSPSVNASKAIKGGNLASDPVSAGRKSVPPMLHKVPFKKSLASPPSVPPWVPPPHLLGIPRECGPEEHVSDEEREGAIERQRRRVRGAPRVGSDAQVRALEGVEPGGGQEEGTRRVQRAGDVLFGGRGARGGGKGGGHYARGREGERVSVWYSRAGGQRGACMFVRGRALRHEGLLGLGGGANSGDVPGTRCR
jgi:hypothetical protein